MVLFMKPVFPVAEVEYHYPTLAKQMVRFPATN